MKRGTAKTWYGFSRGFDDVPTKQHHSDADAIQLMMVEQNITRQDNSIQ